jgi:hypothetical protein
LDDRMYSSESPSTGWEAEMKFLHPVGAEVKLAPPHQPRPRAAFLLMDHGMCGETFLVLDRDGATYFYRPSWPEQLLGYDWRDSLREGDVIRTRAGTERIVREASYRRNGHLSAVVMTIAHCSWTSRCYTTVNRVDLKCAGYRALESE